ncbi:MAG: hypothetical protein K0R54_5027 [Clostridiaceae bacterium]|jgi:glucan-binding YG repeat protein|nr:hypothetical protein [Clostridiaceae bacterium]
MNKNIKKIIAIAFMFSAFCASMPAASMNLLTTKAYAASNSNKYFDTLELLNTDGDNIKFYEKSDYKENERVAPEDVEADTIYYAKTSADTVRLDMGGVSSKYVRVFRGTDSKGKKINTDIRLSKSFPTTLITMKVYSEEPADDVRYSDDTNVLTTYKVRIEYTGTDDNNDTYTDDSHAYDDIFLDKLNINNEDIPLYKSKTTYTYNVPTKVNEATIKVKPENDDYSVLIDNHYVDSDDKYKKTVDLYKGENKFEIEVKYSHSDYYRKYTLIINRGDDYTTSNTTDIKTDTKADDAKTVKPNQWIQVSGQWQYNDVTGNPVKRTWMGNYYLQDNGNMATDWLNINGIWYYFGADGAKRTGWQEVGDKWYYFDSFGMMKTGWILDANTGKYYYLGYDGSMAYNTTVGQYKLGPNGAWTK